MGVVKEIRNVEDSAEELQYRLNIASGTAHAVWLALQSGIETEDAANAMTNVCREISGVVNDMDELIKDIIKIRAVFK